jgi:hypothetical protein
MEHSQDPAHTSKSFDKYNTAGYYALSTCVIATPIYTTHCKRWENRLYGQA